MRYAETGYNLEIDLATGNIEKVETDPKLMELHLGGLGTDVKLMWDRVPPETKAFDPENLLIFSSGLLCGTPAFSANRTLVTTISPQTDLLAYPMMGGFWSAELKYAGYDKVIIRNKSPKLVYIWIHNDRVEIRDASHLKGKGALETQDLIRAELKEPRAQVAAIGLAGENRVFTASVEQSRSSASRLGSGAVMGDKGVKAIAVRGTKDIYLARGAEFMRHVNDLKEFVKHRNANPLQGVMTVLHSGVGSPQAMKHADESWHTTGFAWGNARARRKDFWTGEIEKSWTKTQTSAIKRFISCFNCPQQCGALIAYQDVPRYMMKCFSKLTYTLAAYVDDLGFSFRICQRAFEYGLDSFSTPQILAFAVELYEAGILTDADFAGCPSDKEGRFFWLLDKVARREGIGDILADGTYWAARRIGKGAEAFEHNTIKKHEQMNIKLGMLDPLYYLMFSTNEKVSITQIEGNWPQAAYPSREKREEWVKDWPQLPDEKFKQYFLDWEPRGESSNPYYPTPEISSEIVDWMEMVHNIDDALGLCAGMGSFCYKPAYHIHNYPKFISSATGMDIDEAGLKKIVNRSRNLHRAFNNRRGMSRADEKPPEDHWRHRFPELEEKLLSTYYKFKGWNYDGIPTKERLLELDLGYVAEDLKKRGILKDGQDCEEEQNYQS
ncbi:tungsten-containing aldehyde:ferredoxin oxidoreductase [Desulfocucumis palustris]|uniref:Tungsten-containing aldehyde:ferredoxin oxidoreductase n=1 Tax=Desulfocucumis palustris TaxID=1898651 RepID=A0A2L2XEI3_9FIRM|nr:aldehyde ferredoxin oxidoreductase N-terminal domain-containing protein [Desulfocucumis palustris]GBF34645.1 tungsten-containing aldehyde:ferredoxin oxidoreductase [Desulfocucumis palustris]